MSFKIEQSKTEVLRDFAKRVPNAESMAIDYKDSRISRKDPVQRNQQSRKEPTMKYLIPFLALLNFLSAIAHAETRMVNGHTLFWGPPIESEKIDHEPITALSSDAMAEVARSARTSRGHLATIDSDQVLNDCLKAVQEAAKDGDCYVSFFSRNATCNGDEEPLGCFESKAFKKALKRGGFRVRKYAAPTANEDDDCRAISVHWCSSARKH